MMSDLTRFRQEIFTSHLTFDPNPQSVEAAAKNVEKVYQSLDSWQDRIKERIEAIDQLCRNELDTLTPEQYSALRTMRKQLADEYETVLRNVEGIHKRLNILSALLIEFSSLTSSMQSWMTDRTRLAGDIHHKSGDPQKIDEARAEARALLEEVIREEARLKTIGASVLRIEQEISAMYDDVRDTSDAPLPAGISAEEVHFTRRRVEDDYAQLLRQCQDLIQFQNRVFAMNDEHAEQARRADEWLHSLQRDIDDVERSRVPDDERIQRIEELNRMAAGGSSQLDEAESASKRLLSALEGTRVADDVRARHEQSANNRRGRHQEVLDRIQQNMMEVASRQAEAEGVKQAVANLKAWSAQTAQKTRDPVELPLNEVALNEARRDEQLLHGEIDNRLALIDELEKRAKEVGDSESVAELNECRKKLKRSNSDLKGLRDNIFDAINGLQTVNADGEKLARAVDAVSSKIRASSARDVGKMHDAEADVDSLQRQAQNLDDTVQSLCALPNVTKTEPVVEKTRELRKRVDSCVEELEAKRGKLAELENLIGQFDDRKQNLNNWIANFDDEFKALEKVSIDKDKLGEQRKQTLALADRQSEAQAILDELESLAQQLTGVEDAQGAVKGANAMRAISEMGARLQKQANDLKARGDQINKMDVKATAFGEAETGVLEYMERRKEQLDGIPVPVTKEGVKSQLLDFERMDKTGRGEQRRVEEARLCARELARQASVEKEVQEMNEREKRLADTWDDLADKFDAARDRARNAEKILDECAQIDKWINAKQKMVDAIGAPSTDAAVAKAQSGQIQLMRAETESEKSALENVNSLANEMMAGANKESVEELMKKMDALNRRWHSLESGLDGKAGQIEEAAKLGDELRQIYKELKNELGELESNVDKASAMSPNDIGDQLATLDSLKSRFGGVDNALDKLKTILEATEELEVDATNRAEIQEQLENTQKKADELERKIENVKKAALNAQNEGVELEKKLDDLLSVVNSAENELEQAAPIAADSTKLADELKRAEELYGKLLENDGDVAFLKAKVADELKKKPDAELKNKLDSLNSKWPKTVAAARDRKDLVLKAGELVKQFTDGEQALEQRLSGDQSELESLLHNENSDAPTSTDVCDALKLVEMTMARRLADVDALNAVMNRIEASAPGPDANRLRRRTDKLADDCKGMAKKARTAAAAAQRKHDFLAKFERLVEEVEQFAGNQKAKIEDAVEKEQMNNERVQSKLNEIEDFWSLKNRELKTVGDEIKKDGSPEDAQNVDTKLTGLQSAIDELLAILKGQNERLEEKKEAAERVQSESQKAANKINSLVAEIADLDPVGRSRDELKRQKSEVAGLSEELDGAQTKLIELGAEWEAALDTGIVGQPAFETNKAMVDELNKLAARAGKRLAQREKKLAETEDEIAKLQEEADDIVDSLRAVAANEVLTTPSSTGSGQQDPKVVAEKVRQLKDALKPVGEKMDAFNSDCKLMIKTAGPEADTKELDAALKRVGDAWSDVVGKVADKEMTVDAAVQQQGRVEDAYRALLNWFEETEEMMENQKKPSADAKVAKAQLHAYEVLMKHVEDKKASVDGFAAMIEKMADAATNEDEKKALRNKNQQIGERYKELLGSAVDRQRNLLDAVDLAERLQEVVIPLENWLQSAEKRLQGLAKVPITVEKAEEMLGEQESLQDELEHKSDELKAVLDIAPLLSSFVSVDDANVISAQVQQLENRARALDAGITNMRPLLEDFLQQIQDFTLDAEDMTQFVAETEIKLADLEELPIEPDDLVEQTNILAEIAVSIADRDAVMSNIFEVGKQLAIQGEPEEALVAQNKLDDLKFRYADLMSSADEKIALLAKAIPLSERFHEGFDDVMEVLEAMDRDLQTIDEEDPETQAELIFLLEDDISSKLRPNVDELTVLSTQLQALCSPEKADELLTNTVAMNKLVNSVADRVARRAERIEMANKQSRAVLDDLNYLVEWFTAARNRIIVGAQPSLDVECLKSQLKQQRILNEEANANKVQFRNVAGEARKVARQLGVEGQEANDKLADIVDEGKELVEEVTSLCADRTETLERGLALMEQLTQQFEDLNKWLDQMDAELSSSASVTTATPAVELRAMHDHNEELARMVAAYRPIIDGFKSDVNALEEILAEDQAPLLDAVAGELVTGYEDVREAVRARGQAIDNMMNTTIGFGERLETLVSNLQGAADRLKENEGISADPSILEGRLAENRSIVESLRDKQNAYDALKQTANELLASAPEGDAAAGDVENKLNRLEKLWKEIEREAVDRGAVLEDVLDKAKHFWNELDSCQKAVDDLRNRLELVEPATGHPEQLADQQQLMAQVASEMERTRPRIEALSIAGQQLAVYVPDDEKAVIEGQVANVHGGFSTITALFAEKKRDLIAAMEEAMAFHEDLRALLEWLDGAEHRLQKMPAVEKAKQMNEIGQLLDELHRFKDEVDERGVAKEQVVATALQLAADAPPHLAATVRQPVTELNGRWTKLYAALAEREHKLESSMLQMGKLSDAIAQLTAWMDKTRATLVDIAPPKSAVNLRDIEVAQCKLVVVSNDVHAHQHSVDTVNNAAAQYLRTSGALDPETSSKLGEMNTKWDDIQKMLRALAIEMETSKEEAENVGGEVEKWQRWLEETEAQLQSMKPTGGLPETAKFQLDEFRVIKADVEANHTPLEAHLAASQRYLDEQKNDDKSSWLAKTHGAMKSKWDKIKELLHDRETKLQLALDQAVALETALDDMEHWIIESERKLTDLAPISRLLEVVEKQLAEHEHFTDEVAARKISMTQQQKAGLQIQYHCEKKDAIPIKNRIVSLKHRVEKIAGRAAERGKQLTATRDEVAAWQDGVHELEAFVDDVLERIAPEPSTTSSLDRLKAKLEEVKEAQKDVSGKQTLFDSTRKRGVGLAERATRAEYKTIAMANEKMSKRWTEMIKKLRDRLREAEQAVLEGGVFEESMNDLETWVDEELERYARDEHNPVFGDIEVVKGLVDEEARRAAERKTKENGVKTVVKKADALLASGVDESDSIAQAKERLVDKWQKVEDAARARGESIKEAEQAAEEFDAKTHALLDWLAVEEQKLKTPAANVKAALGDVENVKKNMADAEKKYGECLAKGAEILEKCKPEAESTLRNWMRVVEARWKEVSEKVDEREFALLEEEQRAKERDEQIEKLAKFAAQKRDELNKMIDRPPAQDLDTMEASLREFADLDFELREKQPEVDTACKSSKKGGVRNPAAEMLSTEWKKLWLDAMGLQSSLDTQKALLEEMKRLEGWKWEDWKERYVEWNDHAKARVSDLFRRIDRLHTGNVPRQVFIDGIIGSKFPTSRLEMEKVADLFDKGDRMINAKEFINALRFDSANRNAKPQTDTEKITHEIERQKKTCSCCQPYQIEKISDNHYRSQKIHLKTAHLVPFLPLNDGILDCRSPASEDARDSGLDGESINELREFDTDPTRLNRPALRSDGARGILDGRPPSADDVDGASVYPAVPPSPPLIGTLLYNPPSGTSKS
uniref:GAR domain-containing protein n=1 Tax=Caenorhabditis japonica TaxID=281687 RepID=A0A8R1E2J6_CAEJA